VPADDDLPAHDDVPAPFDLSAPSEASVPSDTPSTPDVPAFRVGVAPGLSLSKWGQVWAERRRDTPLVPEVVDGPAAVTALHQQRLDAALVRLPVEREGLSAIPLYREVAVVVVPKDHPVSLYEEVAVADLVDEDLIQDPDTVPGWRDAAARLRTTPRRPPPEAATTADAIALVAAGLGVLVVPQSVARLHHRRDLTYRPVTDVAETQVALVWPEDRTTDEVEELIGIVRGRTARSSRSPVAAETPATPEPVTESARAPRRDATPPGRGRRSGPPRARQTRRGKRR
jgi:DNA-binding transcriptional LysR family regulator